MGSRLLSSAVSKCLASGTKSWCRPWVGPGVSPFPHICMLTATAGGVVQGPRWFTPTGSSVTGLPQSALCHLNVFWFLLQNLAYEIILTLGQAFEVAYQLALQARKGGHSSTLPESFENKPSKPIPKPRVSIRKSVVSRKDADAGENLDQRTRGCSPGGCGEGCWLDSGPAFLHLCLGLLPARHVSAIFSAQFLESRGTICLNLQAPEKTRPPRPSPLAAGRGWALLLSLRIFPEGPRLGTVFPEPPGPIPPREASASPWPVGRLAEVHSEGDSTHRKLDAQAVGSRSRAIPTFEFGVLGSLGSQAPGPTSSSSAFLQEFSPLPSRNSADTLSYRHVCLQSALLW